MKRRRPKHTRPRSYHGRILRVQNFQCFYCQKRMMDPRRPVDNPGKVWTIDHLFPRALGGPDRRMNMVYAHQSCNQEKGDRIPGIDEVERAIELHVRIGHHDAQKITRFLTELGRTFNLPMVCS